MKNSNTYLDEYGNLYRRKYIKFCNERDNKITLRYDIEPRFYAIHNIDEFFKYLDTLEVVIDKKYDMSVKEAYANGIKISIEGFIPESDNNINLDTFKPYVGRKVAEGSITFSYQKNNIVYNILYVISSRKEFLNYLEEFTSIVEYKYEMTLQEVYDTGMKIEIDGFLG